MISDYYYSATNLHFDVVKLRYGSLVSVLDGKTISDVFPTDRSTTLDHQPSLGNQYTTLPTLDERFLCSSSAASDPVTRNAWLGFLVTDRKR